MAPSKYLRATIEDDDSEIPAAKTPASCQHSMEPLFADPSPLETGASKKSKEHPAFYTPFSPDQIVPHQNTANPATAGCNKTKQATDRHMRKPTSRPLPPPDWTNPKLNAACIAAAQREKRKKAGDEYIERMRREWERETLAVEMREEEVREEERRGNERGEASSRWGGVLEWARRQR